MNAPARAAGGLGKAVVVAAGLGIAFLLGRLSRGHQPRPDPDQAWFWTKEWQTKEAEASADIAAGRVEHFDSDEAFLAAFDPDAKR